MCPVIYFYLAIVLSLLRFTDSDYLLENSSCQCLLIVHSWLFLRFSLTLLITVCIVMLVFLNLLCRLYFWYCFGLVNENEDVLNSCIWHMISIMTNDSVYCSYIWHMIFIMTTDSVYCSYIWNMIYIMTTDSVYCSYLATLVYCRPLIIFIII